MADCLTIKEVNSTISASVDGVGGGDPWLMMLEEARSESAIYPSLKHFYRESILARDSLGSALAHHLGKALSGRGFWPSDTALVGLLQFYFTEDRGISCEIKEDLRFVSERRAPFKSYLHTLLFSRGFLALAAYRVAYKLWSEGKKAAALCIQNFVSNVLAVDILPEEKIKRWMLIDNATGNFDENTVTIFRGKVQISGKKVAECSANVVRQRLSEYSDVLDIDDDIRKHECILSTYVELIVLKSLLHVRKDPQLVKVNQAVVGNQVSNEEPLTVEESSSVVGDLGATEESLAVEESLSSSSSSHISQKNCLQLAISWVAKCGADLSAQAHRIYSFVLPDVGSASPGSPQHVGGQALDHQSNGSSGSPELAVDAQVSGTTSSAAAQDERLPAPSGNGGADERQPRDDEENQVRASEQPDNINEETRRNLFTVASACLATSGAVGIALPAIRFTRNVHLSGNVSLLLSLAEISSVVGFSLSLGGFILVLRNRGSGLARRVRAGLARLVPAGLARQMQAGIATRVLTGAGCVFTTCGFLLIMGTQLPESVMLWITGFTCLIPITVIPLMF